MGRNKTSIVSVDEHLIASRIYVVRGNRVMFDHDLAELYGVPTKRLNEAVKRNKERFPSDFMHRLTRQEVINLKSQFATSSWGGSRMLPSVFTEHGVLMLSNVLKSTRAIQVSIQIIRTFVKLRSLLTQHRDLARQVDAMEKKYDHQFKNVFDAIRQLIAQPPSKPIKGFAER